MTPLAGLTVLDLTHMLSGPYATQLLADLGARTIKVEPPGRGEATRELLRDDPLHSRDGMGAYFLTLNRNKQSVAIDLKHADGRGVFLDLVARADVVVDNFAAGVTTRLGIDHAALAAVNPRIVTCSITGFGATGPGHDRPAFDQVVQAMGGGMSITGEPGGPPLRAGIPIGDLGGGLFAAIGVLAAVQERHVTGRGRHVDISMLDAQISMLNYMATMYLLSGIVPGPMGNGHFVHVPYNCYPTADGHLIVACLGDAIYERLLTVLDAPELHEPPLRRQPARLADKARIDAVMTRELQRAPTADWLRRLGEARVPCGPVQDFAQALSDPQVLARDMVVPVTLPTGETIRMPGNPVRLDPLPGETPQPPPFTAPPALGAQTDDVLGDWLGYTPERIARLRAAAAIA
ncbi:CaiB/BaiF CoA transferase family protein [Ramlibacter sp.]|uniref:CaiB/BaiF CoA transferase family protein n=1 Tax=Ramlibacter sp. TaxID=1917967 RepID=UPI0035B41E21